MTWIDPNDQLPNSVERQDDDGDPYWHSEPLLLKTQFGEHVEITTGSVEQDTPDGPLKWCCSCGSIFPPSTKIVGWVPLEDVLEMAALGEKYW